MGTVARLTGEYEQAEQQYREGLAIARETGEGRGVATCLGNLGWLACETGDYPEAESLLAESLARFEQTGNPLGVALTLCRLGYVACALGGDRLADSRQWFCRALAIAVDIGARPVALNILTGWAALQVAGQGDSAREQAIEWLALARHHPAAEQETRDRAARRLDNLASGLPPEAVTAAQKRGKLLDLDSEAARILDWCD